MISRVFSRYFFQGEMRGIHAENQPTESNRSDGKAKGGFETAQL